VSPDARRSVAIPIGMAVGLPLAFARFSLLGAALSLIISAFLLLLAWLTAAEALRQTPFEQMPDTHTVSDDDEGQTAA